MGYAIEADGLIKRYRSVVALDEFSVEVEEGTVLGLLCPNGAGKTTAVRVFTTLVAPDGGWARVAGLDVQRKASRLREMIGLSGQYAAVDDDLTGFENLDLVGRLWLTLTNADEVTTARTALLPLATGEITVNAAERTVTVPVDGSSQSLVDAVRRLDGAGVGIMDVRLRRPTLDDVFLVLTGHSAGGTEHTTEVRT